ncbi:MAG: hypothetical protein R3F59_37565 [Myxococcota bacterium]
MSVLLAVARLVLVGLFAAVSTAAHAQTPGSWQEVAGAVLSPNPGLSYMAESVSSPTVMYDANRNRFMMIFEAKTNNHDARCPQGVWALGFATSPDGVTWTPRSTPLVNPQPGNGRFYSCALSHPTAVYNPTAYGGNGVITLFAKGEQDTDACAVTTPSWGCDQITGIGWLQIYLDAGGSPSVVAARSTPVLDPPPAAGAPAYYGYPKVVRKGGVYRVLYQVYPDIWSAYTGNLTNFPDNQQRLEIAKNDVKLVIPWVRNELFNPSLVCDDAVGMSYAGFIGGRLTNATGVVSGGWGKAVTNTFGTGATFALDATAQVEFTGDDTWRHWDVHKLTTGDYLVWFDEKTASGNIIRFGGTTLTFNNADVVSKTCP